MEPLMNDLPVKVEFETDAKTHLKIFNWAQKKLGIGNFDYVATRPPAPPYYCFRSQDDAALFIAKFIKPT
jgi:hypothetical protein